jgi:ABC-type polysaccharide/polyol phosphate transport system ATPase subunit
MSSDDVLVVEQCSKFYIPDFNAGRRYLFSRLFWGRRSLPPQWHERVVYALRDIDLHLAAGEKLNVVGPPRSGKTMLGYLLAGLLVPSTGRHRRTGHVAHFESLLSVIPPLMTTREFVGFSVFLSGHGGEVRQYNTDEILASVGLQSYASRYLRDVPVRLLKNLRLELLRRSQTRTIVLDDPEADALAALAERPDYAALTLVVLSRKPHPALEAFDRLAVMSEGRLVYDGRWIDGIRRYKQLLTDLEPASGAVAKLDIEAEREWEDDDDDEDVEPYDADEPAPTRSTR